MKKTLLSLYALYDEKETCVFVGSSKECIEYTNSNINNFYNAICKGYKIARKYNIYKIEEKERFENEKTCNKCGITKTIESFPKRGNYYRAICKECYNEYYRNKRNKKTTQK